MYKETAMTDMHIASCKLIQCIANSFVARILVVTQHWSVTEVAKSTLLRFMQNVIIQNLNLFKFTKWAVSYVYSDQML